MRSLTYHITTIYLAGAGIGASYV